MTLSPSVGLMVISFHWQPENPPVVMIWFAINFLFNINLERAGSMPKSRAS
jgi:hypothetical protein